MSVRGVISGLLVCGVLCFLSACSSAAAQAGRLFTAGDYAGAARGYEEALDHAGGREKAIWLYRLGVSRAIPGGRAYDPAKALKAFDRLQKEFPESSYSRKAELPMALLKALETAGRESTRLRSELDETRDRLHAARQTGRAFAASEERVSELTEQVDRQDQTIKELRKELEQLKAIDLNRPH